MLCCTSPPIDRSGAALNIRVKNRYEFGMLSFSASLIQLPVPVTVALAGIEVAGIELLEYKISNRKNGCECTWLRRR